MTAPPNDDRSQARREAALLLGVNVERLSPADNLRVDMVSALRLVIDAEQASVLAGSQADLGKLNVAVQSLIALLPGRELPKPEHDDPSRTDPRETMLRAYMQMRARGELFERTQVVPGLQARIAELERELATLRGEAPAQGNPPVARAADNVVHISPSSKPAPAASAVPQPQPQPPSSQPPPQPAWQTWLDNGGRSGGHWASGARWSPPVDW